MLYLRELADEISGISRQRRGDMLTSDGLGVTQEAVIRSSKLTEELFQEHEYTKQRVLEALLEVSKFTLRTGKNLKLQYVLDDLSYAMYELDSDAFVDTDYGLKIANSTKILALEQIYIQLAHAAMQSGTITLSQLMEIDQIKSVSDKVARLRAYEQEKRLNDQKLQQQQNELQIQIQQAEMKEHESERQHKLTLLQLELANKLEIEKLKISSGMYQNMYKNMADTNFNGIKDDVELEKQRLINDQKDKELAQKQKQWKDEESLKREELRIRGKEIEARLQQFRKQNKNNSKK
jgi:hypothetical protein